MKREKEALPQKGKSRGAGRALAALASVLLLFFIAGLVATWSAAYWLNNTSAGRAWVSQRLAELSAASGYTLEISEARLAGAGQLKMTSLRVSDRDGLFFEAQNLRLGVSFAALLAKTISFDGHIDAATLHRLPLAQSQESEARPLAPFSMPDIYFRSLAISRLDIGRLHLKAPVTGSDRTLQPELGLKLSVSGDRIAFDARLKDHMAALPYPAEMHAKGIFETASLALRLDDFLLKAEAYEVRGRGAAAFTGDGALGLTLEGESGDLAALSDDAIDGKLSLSLKAGGTFSAPEIAYRGRLDSPYLGGLGLGDVDFDGTITDAGRLTAQSQWHGRPVSLAADTAYAEGLLSLDNIRLTAPDLKISGGLTVDTDTGMTNGVLTAAGALDPYQDLIGFDVTGRATAELTLADGLPARLVFSGKDIRTADIAFPTIDGTVTSKGENAHDLSLKGSAKTSSGIAGSFSGRTGISDMMKEERALHGVDFVFDIAKGGKIAVKGDARPDALDLTASTGGFRLDALPLGLPAPLAASMVKGTLHVQGPPEAPEAEIKATLSATAPARGLPAVTLAIDGDYGNEKLSLRLAGKGKGIDRLTGGVSLPFHFSLRPFALAAADDAALSGQAELAADAKSLLQDFLPPDILMSGRAAGRAKIAGTLQKPVLSGALGFSKGSLNLISSGVAFHDIAFDGVFDGDSLTIKSLRATDGKKGVVTAAGTMGLSDAMPADISVKMTHMDFLQRNQNVDGSFNADLRLKGQMNAYMLDGSVRSDRIDVTIPEVLADSIPELNVVAEKEDAAPSSGVLKKVSVNVTFDAPNRVFVRGWGLDAEFGGSVGIGGTLDAPQFTGTLSSRRGRYEEFNRRFIIERAILHFRGTVPPSPYLDVAAVTQADGLQAQVLLTGTIDAPKLSFASDPALPEDEVLSRILFGRDMSRISPFQALELARTMRRFSGRGSGPDPLGTLRGSIGLDELQIEEDGEGGTTVGAGKYISDKVYLELESGNAENSGGANLEVEINPHMKVESKAGQDASGAGVFWQWDY